MSDVQDVELPEENVDLPEADAEIAADEEVEYLEFVGTKPFGTEFYGATGTHTVTRAQMKDRHDVDLGPKEVVWRKGKNGRFLVPVADMTPEAVEVLAADPMFKRVSI